MWVFWIYNNYNYRISVSLYRRLNGSKYERNGTGVRQPWKPITNKPIASIKILQRLQIKKQLIMYESFSNIESEFEIILEILHFKQVSSEVSMWQKREKS